MFKKPITYTDYDGNTVTETFYFNLSKTELLQLEAETPGGLGASLQRIAETQDFNKIVQEFQRIVLAAYGVRSEDGKRFIKTPAIVEEFKQTAAWDALFFELATKADAATAFVTGVFPNDLQELLAQVNVEELAKEARVERAANEVAGLPPLPSVPPPPMTRGE